MLLTDTMKPLILILMFLFINYIIASTTCKSKNRKQCRFNLEGLMKNVAILKMKNRIKQQILGQLGLPAHPVTTEVPPSTNNKERREGVAQTQSNFTVTPTLVKPYISEFLIVSQRPGNLKDSNIIMFQPNFLFQRNSNSTASDNMVVKSANLLIRLKRKRRSKTPTNTGNTSNKAKIGRWRRNKVLSLTVSTVDASGKPDKQIATVKTRVGKSKWFKVSLPSSLIQDMIDQSQSTLLLHIKCRRCRKNAEVILVRGTRRVRRNLSKKNKLKRKRSRRRLSKINKSRPFLIVEVIMKQKSRLKRSLRVHGNGRNRRLRNPYINQRNGRRRQGQKHAPRCSASVTGCCREPFYFDFAEADMDDWIIAPEGFMTAQCLGYCQPRGFNSSVTEQFNDDEQTCKPFQFLPLAILHYTESRDIKYSMLSGVIIADCLCNE